MANGLRLIAAALVMVAMSCGSDGETAGVTAEAFTRTLAERLQIDDDQAQCITNYVLEDYEPAEIALLESEGMPALPQARWEPYLNASVACITHDEVLGGEPGAPVDEVVTVEPTLGQGLQRFPFPIDTGTPHRDHSPITDFASASREDGGALSFTHPVPTSDEGLYGRFWTAPSPPAAGYALEGVRFVGVEWTGTARNTFVVLSLMDASTEDCARGAVEGGVQGLRGLLCAVADTGDRSTIELRLDDPATDTLTDLTAVIDTENLPQGELVTTYPDTVSVERIEWLWSVRR